MADLLTRSTASPPQTSPHSQQPFAVRSDPTTLNKQFLLKEGDGNILYEVTEVKFLKGSCSDCINVLGHEMMGILKSSSLVEVN
jgi:hypothetical protein